MARLQGFTRDLVALALVWVAAGSAMVATNDFSETELDFLKPRPD